MSTRLMEVQYQIQEIIVTYHRLGMNIIGDGQDYTIRQVEFSSLMGETYTSKEILLLYYPNVI